jgi:DNA-directed RNA polymerase specialized sigma24 family protein
LGEHHRFESFPNWFRRRESAELQEIATAPKLDARAIDLRRTLEKCDALDRELLEGHYIEGYTSEELGAKTGCTAVAVRVRLLRLRRKLCSSLRPDQTVRARSRSSSWSREQPSPRTFHQAGGGRQPAIV